MFSKNRISKIIQIIITISSFFYFIYFIQNNIELLKNIVNITIFEISLILILKILNTLFLSNININILKYLNIELPQLESINITVKNTLGNLTTPLKLGTGYKISYLKDNYEIKLTDFIFWNTIFSIINLIPIVSVFIFFSLFIKAPFIFGYESFSIILFFTFLVSLFLISKSTVLNSKIEKFRYFSKRNFLIQISNILYFLSSCLIVFIIASNFTNELQFFSSVSYNTLNSFVNLINLTPGNIGVKETVLVVFNEIHQLSFQVVIITSAIERLLTLISLFFIQIILKNLK
tara:strand:+ start:2385 stop:3257 length:873 start_codon:yes stop_codon:yes gene_type:complete